MSRIREERILGLLGLARKAQKVAFGKDAVRAYLRSSQRNRVIVVASDASRAVKLDWAKRCSSHGACPVFLMKTDRAELGRAIGKKSLSAVAVSDETLAIRIMQLAALERRENH